MDKEIYDDARFWSEYNEKKRRINTSKIMYFQNIILDFDVDLTSSTFKIHFKNCEFNHNTKINTSNESNEEMILECCTFHKYFDISGCKFQKNIKFWESIFNQVNFNNATFNGLADFWSCTFNEKVIFYKTDFLGTTVFSAATFCSPILQ